MKNILFKVTIFCKTYRKRIITAIGSCILAMMIIVGITGGVIYSHAKSNIRYSQEQLQQIALGKIPGKVVNVKKEINFKSQSFQYEFKIKDKDNMLQQIKLDSQYGVIVRVNNGNHKKENKFVHGKQSSKYRKR